MAERQLGAATAPSRVLPGHWLLVQDATLGPTLRLSHDAQGHKLYPTPSERMHQLEAELSRRAP